MIRVLLATVMGVVLLCAAASCGLFDQGSQQAPAGPMIINNMPPAASDSGPLILAVILGCALLIGAVVAAVAIVWMLRNRRDDQQTIRSLQAALNGNARWMNGQPQPSALPSSTRSQERQAPMLEQGQYR
jgi:multisubunit Na+/H+ antiporter MnhC subunit